MLPVRQAKPLGQRRRVSIACDDEAVKCEWDIEPRHGPANRYKFKTSSVKYLHTDPYLLLSSRIAKILEIERIGLKMKRMTP